MDKKDAIAALSALAQDTRLDAFRLLTRSEPEGMPSGDIARALDVPTNTLSSHLALLTRAGLVTSRRRGRSIVYHADIGGMKCLLSFLTQECCLGRPEVCGLAAPPPDTDLSRRESFPLHRWSPSMTENQSSARRYNVLFLCTGNSARSIMAEAALGRWGAGRFQAFSAGSHPAGAVNPFAEDLLKGLKYDTDGFRSKSWDEFAGEGAPDLDFVFTVCDNAAGEVCPIWPGQPMTAHWGVEDPAAFVGPDDKKRKFFLRSYLELESRIKIFTSLRFDALDRLSLQNRLREIGTSRLVDENVAS